MKVNKRLIWDYPFTEKDFQTESFKEWYISRVLTNGTYQDVMDVGLETVRQYLPRLWLPATIEHFWEWYFGLPHAHPTRRDTYYFPERAA